MCFSFCLKSSIQDPLDAESYVISNKSYVNSEPEGWFHNCMVCRAMTSNIIIFMIFLRKDVDTRTYHACNRCKRFLILNSNVTCKDIIKKDPHTELRICRTRIGRGKVG